MSLVENERRAAAAKLIEAVDALRADADAFIEAIPLVGEEFGRGVVATIAMTSRIDVIRDLMIDYVDACERRSFEEFFESFLEGT